MRHAPSPDQEVALWLARLDGALTRRDIPAATELFLAESYWRDMVAFTWNVHTAEGREAIGGMLDACLHHARPAAWQIDGPARNHDGIVEATLTLETACGRGRGVVRLKDGLCWTMFTTLAELKGHEESILGRRVAGAAPDDYRPGRLPWNARRKSDAAELGVTRQPYCLIVGAGHCGLSLGARLKQLDVPTLLIDRQERPSDTWRNRYETLTVNSPSAADHMPYLPFPESWPAFPSKDQMANWLDAYAAVMDLDIWGGAECRRATFNEARDEWEVEIQRPGETVTLRPKQLVFATGLLGPARVPEFPGATSFKGRQLHSSEYRGGPSYQGRRCVVIGGDISAHDVCAALWEVGADVTMVQRSPTIVVRRESLLTGFGQLYSDEAIERGLTPERADLLFASVPLRVMERQQAAAHDAIRRSDAAFYRKLEDAGFLLGHGEDGTGFVPQLFRRGSGYYVDIGASGLIANGDIKVRSRVSVEAITPHGLLLQDGSELPADVIIYATGYHRADGSGWQVLSDEVAARVGKIYGYGSGVAGDPGPWEGEIRNLWKPTQQRSLWFHVGGFVFSRFYSRVLALQIKARQVGLPTPVYALAEVHHRH
jgi:putative flavoprotein involved in K+ transport